MATVEFDREKTVEVEDLDLTLLEIAREAGIPHASACGGNGRCSTCRVMILEHPEHLDPRNAVETRLARAKGFEDNIRLACQTTITGDVKLRRLVIDEEDLQIAQDGTPQTTGKTASWRSCSVTSATSRRSPRATCRTTSSTSSGVTSARSASR